MEGTGLASLQSGVGLGASAFLVFGLSDAHQSAVAQLNGRAVRCRIFAATKKGTPAEARIPLFFWRAWRDSNPRPSA
jgi:hypothetical protein